MACDIHGIRDLGLSLLQRSDVWIRASVRDDGHEYYEMLLIYVDDILAIHISLRY
jgi:hypothetical protein